MKAILFLLVLVLASCQKDDTNPTDKEFINSSVMVWVMPDSSECAPLKCYAGIFWMDTVTASNVMPYYKFTSSAQYKNPGKFSVEIDNSTDWRIQFYIKKECETPVVYRAFVKYMEDSFEVQNKSSFTQNQSFFVIKKSMF